MADEFKTKGNTALQAGRTEEAIQHYTAAIQLDKSNHVLYSNRSAAYAKAGNYVQALTDADECIRLKPDWSKGHSRRGAALEFRNQLEEAKKAYEEALRLDPGNGQLKESLAGLNSRLAGADGGAFSVNNLFGDPNMKEKLERDPKVRVYLKDPDFLLKLEMLRSNPNLLGSFLQDSRIMSAMAVLMGINPDQLDVRMEGDEEDKPARRGASPPSPPSTKNKSEAKPAEEVNLTESQKAALAEKELGNAAYKKKDFPTALVHYNRAIEFEPENITYYTNKAAVYFEMAEYTECIGVCEKAIEVGREHRVDYKLIAKAYARIANAHFKMDDLVQAKRFFDKSLSEFRAPDVLKRSQEVDRLIRERERLQYINPEVAEAEKLKGNELFQTGKYPEAMKCYNEAIKRNPDDAKLYSNRAACYTKLMEFPSALKDCDKCIELDPKFVKGYLRKGACLIAMKEPSKAAEVYRRALDLDPNCQEAIDGYRQCVSTQDPEDARRRAMQDPEIQEILSDPAMQMILGQMQKDPAALQEHLKNPHIAAKIRKLMDSGLIMIR